MTKQKTISSLSIAAIALVAAAVPALAQGQTESSSQKASIGGAALAVEQTIASNLESAAMRKSHVVTPEVAPSAGTVARGSKALVLSGFNGQNNFAPAASSIPPVNFKDAPVDPSAKKQFHADETESDGAKRVTFVSSRGQKLPE